jgi:hypothetical protein
MVEGIDLCHDRMDNDGQCKMSQERDHCLVNQRSFMMQAISPPDPKLERMLKLAQLRSASQEVELLSRRCCQSSILLLCRALQCLNMSSLNTQSL